MSFHFFGPPTDSGLRNGQELHIVGFYYVGCQMAIFDGAKMDIRVLNVLIRDERPNGILAKMRFYE